MSQVSEVHIGLSFHKGTNPNHYKGRLDLEIEPPQMIPPSEIQFKLIVNDTVEAAFTGLPPGPTGGPRFSLTDRGARQLQQHGGYLANLLLVRTDGVRSARVEVEAGGVTAVREIHVDSETPLFEDESTWGEGD